MRASFPSIESANPGVLGQYAQRSKHFDFDFDWRSTQPLQVSQYIIIRTFLQCCALCGIFSASFSGVTTVFRCMAFSLFLYRMHIKIHNIYANLAFFLLAVVAALRTEHLAGSTAFCVCTERERN